MFLRAKSRTKDGKAHRYWSVVENRRVAGGGVVQRQVLYLGELNDNQRAGWVRTIEAFSGEKTEAKQLALFPDGREELPILDCETARNGLCVAAGSNGCGQACTKLRNRKNITRDNLLMHIGALKKEAGRDFGLVRISLPNPQEPVNEHTFRFELDRERLRRTVRREGRYLLRSNMQAASPETVWESYLLLTRVEQAFKDLKGELSIRPIWHRLEKRIEAHIFVSFLAYCLHTTLRNLARGRAAGLTSEAILKKLSTIQMIDIHLPTTDGRHIVMSRYTQPEKDVSLLLAQLGLSLPEQPPPKVYASGKTSL